MIKKIAIIFLFFFLPNTLFPQLNIVKSIKVKSEGHLKSNFIFDKNDVININFDILGKKKDDYYYTITHCDYKWNSSNISKFEYVEGFDDTRISDYFFSQNTFQSYTNFNFQIPNQSLNIKIDGNYIIRVFDHNHNQIFERKIIIKNKIYNGIINITRSKEIKDSPYSQNLQVTFTNLDNVIFNSTSDYKLLIVKNNNLKSSKIFSIPRLQTGSKLFYDNLKFEGGTEYLYFDSKNILLTSNEIRQVDFEKIYNTKLYTDFQESIYTRQPDLNGTFILNANCLQKNICADYSNVIFSLRTNKNYENDIFIIGEFNNNILSEKYKMKKEAKNYYTGDIVLKQGLYNYKYVVKTKNGFKELSNFWQTENNYKAILYEKKITDRYYKIIGFGENNSNKIVN